MFAINATTPYNGRPCTPAKIPEVANSPASCFLAIFFSVAVRSLLRNALRKSWACKYSIDTPNLLYINSTLPMFPCENFGAVSAIAPELVSSVTPIA